MSCFLRSCREWAAREGKGREQAVRCCVTWHSSQRLSSDQYSGRISVTLRAFRAFEWYLICRLVVVVQLFWVPAGRSSATTDNALVRSTSSYHSSKKGRKCMT